MTINRGEPYKRPERYLMAILFISVAFCAMLPYIAPTVLMEDIMTDFGVGLSLAGLSVTIELVVAGICFFIGALIEEKIGILNTIKLCMVSLSIGAIISGFAPNITIFLIGRTVAGFGYGLSVGLSAYINTWFQGKALSYVLTCGTVAVSLSLAISGGLSATFANMLGSWQRVLLLYAGVTVVFTILWFLFGKNSPEGIAQAETAKQMKANAPKSENRLKLALKERQYWKLAIFAIVFTVVDTARATYMPTYFISELALDEGPVYASIGILSIIGMIGAMIGGILAAKLKRRKPILIISFICYMLCGLSITILPAGTVTLVLCVALGFFFNVNLTANQNMTIETAMLKNNPAIISGGFALISGVGMLTTMIVSPAFAAIHASTGSMTIAFRVFFAVCIIGIVAVSLTKETGGKLPTVSATASEEVSE